MADMIKVFQAYSPKIKTAGLVELRQVIKYIADRTGLNTGTLYQVLYELQDSLVFYTKSGYSVRLEGLGLFSPTVNREGGFGLNYRPDKTLLSKLEQEFIGEIRNKKMIGKAAAQFIAQWNEEHPDDLVKTGV
jgi:hypothetical protein